MFHAVFRRIRTAIEYSSGARRSLQALFHTEALTAVKPSYKAACLNLVRDNIDIQAVTMAIDAGLTHGGLDFRACSDIFYEFKHCKRDADAVAFFDHLHARGYVASAGMTCDLAVAMCRAGNEARLLQLLKQQQHADGVRSLFAAVLHELSDPQAHYNPTLLTAVQALRPPPTAQTILDEQTRRRTEPQRATGAATVLSAADWAEFDAFDPERRLREADAKADDADEEMACTGHTLCRGPS